jgi:hypothetical protein
MGQCNAQTSSALSGMVSDQSTAQLAEPVRLGLLELATREYELAR